MLQVQIPAGLQRRLLATSEVSRVDCFGPNKQKHKLSTLQYSWSSSAVHFALKVKERSKSLPICLYSQTRREGKAPWIAELSGFLPKLPSRISNLTVQSCLMGWGLETIIKRPWFWGHKWQISLFTLLWAKQKSSLCKSVVNIDCGARITSAKKSEYSCVQIKQLSLTVIRRSKKGSYIFVWEMGISWNQPQSVAGIAMGERSLPRLTYPWPGIKVTLYDTHYLNTKLDVCWHKLLFFSQVIKLILPTVYATNGSSWILFLLGDFSCLFSTEIKVW